MSLSTNMTWAVNNTYHNYVNSLLTFSFLLTTWFWSVSYRTVQPAPGVDLEGLDVARECLEEVFKLNSYSSDDEIRPGMLIDLFSSMESGTQCKGKSKLGPSVACTTSHSQQGHDSTNLKSSNVSFVVFLPWCFYLIWLRLHLLGFGIKSYYWITFSSVWDLDNFKKRGPLDRTFLTPTT